jgi:uncharacterized ferritin-like protein (DUF455 family)
MGASLDEFSWWSLAGAVLAADQPQAKLGCMARLDQVLVSGLAAGVACVPSAGGDWPRGDYARWQSVNKGGLAKRSPTTVEGRAALLHSIAHIEYCAIDLALDHALRFADMPSAYYADWLRVASDEARHFGLLQAHLQGLGYEYGDFPVHAGLWQMAERTTHDVLARMAMVPRLLEARGLDATPPIQRKLAEVGDMAAVAVLEIIAKDEEDHVRLGDQWYRYLCAQRGLEPEATFRELIVRYQGPWPQTPLNEVARRAAGFSEAEIVGLTTLRPAR